MRRNTTSFIIFIAIALAVLAGISFFTVHVLSPFVPIPYIWLAFVIFPILLIITMILGNASYNRTNAIVYTVSVLWIPVLFYLFFGAIVIGILSFFPIPHVVLEIIVIILFAKIAFDVICGIWSALHPQIKTYAMRAPLLKEKWGGKKIVLFSDVHLGMVRHEKWMRKIVSMVNDLKPDIVFIAGDLIDGPVFPHEKGLAPLAGIKSIYGTFYTAGNHDEYNREQEKYYTALNKYVTVLNDKKTIVNDTQIVGVMFANESIAQTKERLLLSGYEKGVPSIVLLHDPKNVSALAQSGVTLALSGHTHGGQLFPFTIAVKLMYKELAKGIHYIEGMAHFTSVGVGTAGPIMRLGTTPEIAVIEIQ